jgi:3-hydroxy-9,10-secoandrosta-1,3,5(10)-triene-9,17-dione monooxygenase
MAGGQVDYQDTGEALEIARGLAPRFRERVEQAEDRRRLPDETVSDLAASGLLRLEVPRMFGGAALGLDSLLEVTGVIAEACPSTGWVYSLWTSHMWLVAHYPLHIQEAVLADPNARASSVVNTDGTVQRVDGGWVWNGKGFFCSGVDHSNWITAALDVPAEPGGVPERHWMLLKREDYDVIDDWNTVGLMGTGGNTIVVKNAFIPDERVLNARELSEGRGLGATLHDAPIYRTALDFTFSLPLPAAELGIARAAVTEFQERSRERLASDNPRLAAEQAATLLRFALASAEVEAAHTLLLTDAKMFSNMTAAEATILDRARCRRDVSFATQMCRRAVNSLFEASGGSNVYRRSKLQRLWRDSNVAGAHHGLMWDIHGLAYGRIASGLPTALEPVGI